MDLKKSILSAPTGAATQAIPPRKSDKGATPPLASPKNVELSVFDILNGFRRRWFVNRTSLVANATSAQKDESGKFSWVEFTPQYHTHLVKCAVALVPHPVLKVKKVLFVYMLELLNQEGHLAFFELQKGGCKANKAQKEKRRLARKRSRAAKREREREAATHPLCLKQCKGREHQFASRKTTSRYKYPPSEGLHGTWEGVEGTRAPGKTLATPEARVITSPTPITAPTTPAQGSPMDTSGSPTNNTPPPVVTGDTQAHQQIQQIRFYAVLHPKTGRTKEIMEEKLPELEARGFVITSVRTCTVGS